MLFLGHRRTASLPPGPLFNSGGFVPSTPVFKSPSPVFPSLSQFTRVLDETCNSFDADTTDHQSKSSKKKNQIAIQIAMKFFE